MNTRLSETDYYIGLDCGTSSVGFAVTDTDYNILKFNGKSMWGSHLFEEAKTAKERRGARCARRRLQRRRQRIELLQELFAEEVYKVDPTFFIRLNDSQYLLEDKHEGTKNIIFNDSNYKDKDFFKEFKTIYHLRKSLIFEEIRDPRFLYLGIAHILKHRGHFLFPGEDMSDVTSIQPVIDELKEVFSILFEADFDISSRSEFEDALKKKKSGERKDCLDKVIVVEDSKLKGLIVKILSGYKVKPQLLFDNEDYEEVCAIEFRKTSFEEADLPVLEESLSDDEYKLVLLLKSLYDWSLLEAVRGGRAYISEAKIDMFEKNKSDLKKLKEVVKTYSPDKYQQFFHSDSNGSFTQYIGKNHDSHKRKEFRTRRIKVDEFYKSVRAILAHAPKDDPNVIYISNEMEELSFMPLLVSFRNGVIPYQLNKLELKAILQNAERQFPFLLEKDETGLTVSQKIVSILTYRIPYYVGPLNSQNNKGNSWLIRKESGRILPWNISEKVDYDKSAEQFILRMTNKCTYCKSEDVLPKQSLSYSKYMVLNELNNVKVFGKRLSVERKQLIFNDLFKTRKRVTRRGLIDYMTREGWYAKGEVTSDDISGVDGDFKSSMSSYFDFKEYLASGKLKADDVDLIIKWITLFEEGGEILKNRIRDSYGKVLTSSEINRISKLKYSGWGRFSHKFLYEIQAICKGTGELMSIMRMLWETQNNLMELLSNDYEFIEQVDKPEMIGKLDYSVVENLYVSPAVKRQIWQTLKVVDEIQKVMKHAPKKVFIEVTREEGEKKKTVSRKKDLIDKLKEAQKSGSGFNLDFDKLISSLDGKDESQVGRQDKLYLYFSQCGRCMYTNEPIDLDDLYNTELYDIDHIYPYSRSNDDSLKNRVLVKKKENSRKSNDYPIADSVRKKMQPFWKMLLDRGFIPREKYDRLVRSSPLSTEDMKGFVARQLVETSQSTKASAQILKCFFGEETKIVYSKAGNVSDFRFEYEFVKCRSLNDLHHAKDAYLNIVVGNVFDTKYTGNFYLMANGEGYGNLSKPFAYDVPNAWKIGKTGTISIVKKYMKKNDILFTRQPVARSGALFDLQIVKKGSKKGALPIKSSNEILKAKVLESGDLVSSYDEWTSKYGGYNSMTTSYFALVQHEEKKKKVASFIPVAIIDANKVSTNEGLEEYCSKILGLQNPKTIRRKVLMNTELEIDGFRFGISGKANGGQKITLKSNVPLILSKEAELVLKKVESYKKKKSQYKNLLIDQKKDGLLDESLELLFLELVSKSQNRIYRKRPGSQEKVLVSSLEKFRTLSPEEKCDVIEQVVVYFGMGIGLADFSLIGGTKACGFLTKGAKLDLQKISAFIIDKSVTGLFETKTPISV